MTEPSGSTPRRKGPSLRRSMMMDSVRGVPRVRKWPDPRGPAKSAAQRRSQTEFKQASDLIKQTPAEMQIPVMEATKGTPFYPRDIQMMALFGRLWAMRDRNGRLTRTRRMTKDVSDSLDLITDRIGDMLVRGPTGWIGVVQAANFASWQFNRELGPLDTPNSTSTYAFKGGLYRAMAGQDIFALSFWANWLNGSDYQAVVCEVDSSNVITDVVKSNTVTAPEGGLYPIRFDVAAEIIDNTRYAIMVGRIDGSASYALPINFLGAGAFRVPWVTISGARIASLNPAIGDTIDTAGGTSSVVPFGMLVAS